LIYDLESNGLKQVDHRAIEYFIYKNVKYSLGRKNQEMECSITEKWNPANLSIGNWFSATQYFQVTSIPDTETVRVASYGENSSEFVLS
jgi:hypothetical protein